MDSETQIVVAVAAIILLLVGAYVFVTVFMRPNGSSSSLVPSEDSSGLLIDLETRYAKKWGVERGVSVINWWSGRR